jgi:hypothetical protein
MSLMDSNGLAARRKIAALRSVVPGGRGFAERRRVEMALFYSNGGPGPATELWRVNVEGNGSDMQEWRSASADGWTVRGGWNPRENAQLDILFWGEMSMIDASEVPKIQQGMREEMAKYGPLPSEEIV